MINYIKTKISLTGKLAFIFLGLTIGLVSLFAYKSYQDALESYSSQAKSKLQIATTLLIPFHDQWHDRFLSEDDKPTEEEYQALLHKQSKLAEEIGVQYIYTFIYDSALNFYFSSDSANEEDLNTPELHTKLGIEYIDVSLFLEQTVKTNTPIFGESYDMWGGHFSYLVPCESPKGLKYIIGIDLSVDTIKDDALKIFWYWLIFGSLVSTIGFIFAFFAIKPIMKQLDEKNAALEFLAKKDPLTGINNRREFFRLTEEVWNKHEDIFCVMLDLDMFKTLNDTFGHKLGDCALIEFTKIVTAHLDHQSIFGRMGGEEFALIFFNKSSEKVNSIVESIREGTQNISIPYDNQTIRFTVSIGVAKKEDCDCVDISLDKADQMLYEAKQSGRNKVRFRTIS